MNGIVDLRGRALLTFPIRGATDGPESPIWINWFGEDRDIEVIVSSGQNALLGVRLLLGHRLVVDYQSLKVSLD